MRARPPASSQLPKRVGISSLQLAPQGVVEYVFPIKGNEKAIGINVLKGVQ